MRKEREREREREIESYFFVLQLLASVGLDDHHTLNVWDWGRGKVMASARGHGDRIFEVRFGCSPAAGQPPSLVTCGVKHIKFWTLCGNTLSGKKGIFGKKGKCHKMMLAALFSNTFVSCDGQVINALLWLI